MTYSEIVMVAATICTAVGAFWNSSKFTRSTGKFLYSIYLESKSVLGAKFSCAYNTFKGAPKYTKLYRMTIHPIFKISQNFVLPLIYFCLNNLMLSLLVGMIMRMC